MATTIVTKSGDGAPTASDLVAGELAVDLTNKRLYTENSGGTVLELGTNPSGDITFGDNGKAIFGAGSDLQIYHDGADSYINDSGVGDLKVGGNQIQLNNAAQTKNYIYAVDGAQVELKYNNALKLATTATGIDVTGTVTATGTSVFASLDISGDIDVDGTTNLDVVDIDGAVDMASTLAVGGQLYLGATSGGNGLGSFLNQGTGANFYEASDGTKTMIAGTDGGNAFVKLGSLSAHPVGFVAGNGLKFQIDTDGSISTPTAGTNNVRFGVNAGNSIASGGNYNTVVGDEAGTAISTGDYNVAVGYAAGTAVQTGVNNTIIGGLAGATTDTGSNNVFVGMFAGNSNISGSYNTFVGRGNGYGAGDAMTTGSSNVILGAYSGNNGGLDIRTSSNNIVLSDGDGNPRGYYHGGASFPHWVFETPTDSQWAMSIKNTVGSGFAPYGLNIEFSNAVPNDTTRQFLRGGDVSNRFIVYSNGNVVNVNNSYGAISDEKLKENIVDSSSQWEDIKALTVRKYSMKADNLDAPNMLGVVAQEVEAAGMGGLVYESPDLDKDLNDLGTVTKQVNYSILYMKAVKALQEAMDRIETLEAKVAALES